MIPTPIDRFVEALCMAAGPAFSGKAPSIWTVKVDEKPRPFPAGTQLLTLLLVAEPSNAEAAIQISLQSALSLAAAAGGAATIPAQFQPEHGQALQAVFARACEKAALVLEGIRVQVQLAKNVNWTPARQCSLTGTDGGSGSIQFQLLFSPDWPQSVTKGNVAATQPSQTAQGVSVSALENVEIAVTLRFGERQLPLREIGQLRSGSVIELDKRVQDPAELLLGDRVVARGEVVIVDGNYGLRITEVV
jgi:flagellar motor switch protein FliN